MTDLSSYDTTSLGGRLRRLRLAAAFAERQAIIEAEESAVFAFRAAGAAHLPCPCRRPHLRPPPFHKAPFPTRAPRRSRPRNNRRSPRKNGRCKSRPPPGVAAAVVVLPRRLLPASRRGWSLASAGALRPRPPVARPDRRN